MREFLFSNSLSFVECVFVLLMASFTSWSNKETLNRSQQHQIKECEKNLLRSQTCILIAVPKK